MTAEPEPLTPANCDLRAFRDLPLDFQRFRDSDLMTLEPPDVIVAAIMLWGAAWHQVPAASLPDDDRVLARYAGYGRAVSQWQAIREGALRGFVRCSDGRLYHRTLAEKANSAWSARLKYEWSKAADRHRKSQRGLAEDEKTEFPAFEDWLDGRDAPLKAENRQPDLPLESSTGTPLRARAHAHTARGRTGAQTVPSANSSGTSAVFHRNDPEIPLENALKGREGKGRDKEEESSHPTTSTETRAGRLGNADLKVLFDTVCAESGFNPTQPAAIDRAMTQIEKWRDAHIDFDDVILPAIRAEVLTSPDPTRTLGRFDKRIRHEHARAKAAEKKSEQYVPPQVPKLNPDGEDPVFLPLRTDLLEALGERSYCTSLNKIRFKDDGECQGDRHPLKIEGPDYLLEPVRRGQLAKLILDRARNYGFTEIW
jgi:hypothetical protein